MRYSLDELCQLLNMSRRTVRYYIQEGLIDRPEGQKRGSYYTDEHVAQLQRIGEWQREGYSLERIRALISGEDVSTEQLLALQPKRGDVVVWSRVHITPGVELHINPELAGLSPEQTRTLFQQIGEMVDGLKKGED
jgi:DNA-binding transcriptional MerR regulator